MFKYLVIMSSYLNGCSNIVDMPHSLARHCTAAPNTHLPVFPGVNYESTLRYQWSGLSTLRS